MQPLNLELLLPRAEGAVRQALECALDTRNLPLTTLDASNLPLKTHTRYQQPTPQNTSAHSIFATYHSQHFGQRS